MQHNRVRLGLAIAGAALAVATVASPVAAAAPEQFTWSDEFVANHDCGIVESTTVQARETVWFEDGTWVRTIVQFEYVGTFTGPTGETYTSASRQLAIVTPETESLSGQGIFLRGAGGVLVMDAGHLSWYRGSGEYIQASAQVIEFGDAEAFAEVEAALCERLG